MNEEELIQIGNTKSPEPLRSVDQKALYIKTFGCQMNVYDSEKLERILSDGYYSVENPEDADLILVNTCSVRDKPEQKLYSMLGEYSQLKENKPGLMVGVGGCVAQQEGENIVKRSKTVDFVFGTHNLSLVPSLIDRRLEGQPPQVAIDYRDEWEDLPLGLSDKSRVSVFVSISRGCNKNCTYCIVPTTRGPEVSRDPSEIEREVKIAVHRGAREIVLLGQTVNSYGLDLNPRMKFTELLERVGSVDKLERIRFTSPHPQEVRQDFYDLVSRNPKVCKHIHMPLQSGSDSILKAMNRNYRSKRYKAIIDGLRAACPEIAITTDIIVGFPGETDEDFEQTMELLEYVKFSNSYSFMFSPRPGTKAAEMSGQLPHEVKLERLQRYQARQSEITSEYLQSRIGTEAELLLDGPSANDSSCLMGRTSQNVVVNLEDADEALEPGMLVKAKITAAARHTLKGRVS